VKYYPYEIKSKRCLFTTRYIIHTDVKYPGQFVYTSRTLLEQHQFQFHHDFHFFKQRAITSRAASPPIRSLITSWWIN